jgi:ketol-acid reductoisomerase
MDVWNAEEKFIVDELMLDAMYKMQNGTYARRPSISNRTQREKMETRQSNEKVKEAAKKRKQQRKKN